MCIPAVQMVSKSALRFSAVLTASNGASGYQNGIEGHSRCPDGINKGALRLSCQNGIEGCTTAVFCPGGIDGCSPAFCCPDVIEGRRWLPKLKDARQLPAVQITSKGAFRLRRWYRSVRSSCLLSRWHRRVPSAVEMASKGALQMFAAQMASKGALHLSAVQMASKGAFGCRNGIESHPRCLLPRWHPRVHSGRAD